MPPIEMIASPVGNRISIPIPREYRAYSFQVTLVPVKADNEVTRRRVARTRCKEASASLWDQLACPVFDEGEGLDISRDRNDCGRAVLNLHHKTTRRYTA